MRQHLQFMLDKHPDIIKGESPYIVVRFNKEMHLDYEQSIEEQLPNLKIENWQKLKSQFPDIRMIPHFSGIKPSQLNELIKKATTLDQTYRPANFFNYFKIEYKDPFKLFDIEEELKGWKNIIEYVQIYIPAPDPAVNATNDPRAVNQGYLNAAPNGIDARYAWGFTGGDGAGVRIVDMERGWTFNHEDLSAHGITLINGTILDSSRSHGTAVLGEVCAVDNTIGCVGIAPHVASVMASSYNGSTQVNAILAAITALSFGDVLLLEVQVFIPGLVNIYGPTEVLDDNYDAIRLATALGVVVVEAGGNGTNNGSTPAFNLDTYVNPSGNAILNPTSPTFRDSGAIIVTAASSASPHIRLAYGPHGQRIDCYAWGQNINTLDSDDSGATTLYRTEFGGTSGASPIITGAALVVQGIAQANLGFRFSPRQMRAILRNPVTGTAPSAAETTLINVMPNLRLIIDNQLNISPDVYIRDFVGDIGNPHSGAISVSPDVIIQTAVVGNPQTSFGEGSGTENNSNLGETVTGGVNNFIYVRVRNRGGSAANGVQATVYWSPVASLVTPDLWTLIGTTPAFNVPNGDLLTVSNSITWNSAAIPGTGHYCFVALINHPLDPAPLQADFNNWTNFNAYIRNNNNVTWRNFNVVSPAPSPNADPQGFVELPFLIVGAPDKTLPFDFVIEGRLPQGAKMMLELPLDLFKKVEQYFSKAEIIDKYNVARVFLNPFTNNLMKSLRLKAKYKANCRILVAIPKDLQKNKYQIRLRQMYEELQVGGITWLISDKPK